MALLEVKNLKKVYTTRFTQNQVQALTNVNFSVNKGEYVAIMGESGSGKTTLLNILAALDKPTSGQVLLHGKDITHISEKEIENVWLPFYRTDKARDRKLGTGLGLAIVKEILKTHKLNFGAYKEDDKIIFWFEGGEE